MGTLISPDAGFERFRGARRPPEKTKWGAGEGAVGRRPEVEALLAQPAQARAGLDPQDRGLHLRVRLAAAHRGGKELVVIIGHERGKLLEEKQASFMAQGA